MRQISCIIAINNGDTIMFQRTFNTQAGKLKKFVLITAECFIEPILWREFCASENFNGYNGYVIHDDDLANIRDLKAFVNMLTIAEKMSETYALWPQKLYKWVTFPGNALDFYQNYKIYMATTSPMSHYLNSAKLVLMSIVAPWFKAKFYESLSLCTSENFQMIVEFIIERVVELEQFQEKYEALKRKPIRSIDPNEGAIGATIRTSEFALRKIYGDEEYEVKFESKKAEKKEIEKKDPDKKELEKTSHKGIRDYYPEKKDEAKTVKHIKKFLNAVIGLGKLVEHYDSYNKSWTGIAEVFNGSTEFLQIVSNFKEFDYKAIFAEQSNPLAKLIKDKLQSFNDGLKMMACYLDKIECETCIREGLLLNHLQTIIKYYNDIIDELGINIDTTAQKHIFRSARLESRKSYKKDIADQLQDLAHFRFYKDCALNKIPKLTLKGLMSYVEEYYDDICVDREHLAVYKKYLAEAIASKEGDDETLAVAFESIGNIFSMTIHSEVMEAFRKRRLYLTKMDKILDERTQKLDKLHQDHPFEFFNTDELKSSGHYKYILDALRSHLNELNEQNDTFTKSAVYKQDPDKNKPPRYNGRWERKITSKGKEAGEFKTILTEVDKCHDINVLYRSLQNLKKDAMSLKSRQLLEEIELIKQINIVEPEKKDDLSVLKYMLQTLPKDKLSVDDLRKLTEIEKILQETKQTPEAKEEKIDKTPFAGAKVVDLEQVEAVVLRM